GYHLGVHLVTQWQWEQVLGKDANHSRFMGKDEGEKKKLPVDYVSWEDCQQFCEKLGELEGRHYQLPSEAEWEYACRAGTTTPFHYGIYLTSTQANFDGRYHYGKAEDYLQRTCKVGSYRPNAFGLYDMHGNVWEWCSDWFDEDYYKNSPRKDPRGPDIGEYRVMRGGSWNFDLRLCRSA